MNQEGETGNRSRLTEVQSADPIPPCEYDWEQPLDEHDCSKSLTLADCQHPVVAKVGYPLPLREARDYAENAESNGE